MNKIVPIINQFLNYSYCKRMQIVQKSEATRKKTSRQRQMNPCKNKISLDPNPEYMTGDRDRVVEMVVVVVGVRGRHGRGGGGGG